MGQRLGVGAVSGYEILPEFELDSHEWHEARRGSLGASEVAAVLGLSPWQTPLSVWRTKVLGETNAIPEDLAFFGHALEGPIAKWIREKRPEVGDVSGGFGARSIDHPWLTASPDRMAGDIPIELKTSSAFSRAAWDAGVPDYYKVQVQTQLLVLGAPYGWLAVLHGGNSPELYRIDADPIVQEQIVRITGEWWETHVVGEVAPDPVTYAEALEVYPGVEGQSYEVSDEEFANLEQRDVDAADMNHLKKRVDAFKDYIAPAVGDATVLTYQGEPRWTYKRQNGAPQTRVDLLKEKYPEAYAECVYVPRFPVLRRIKQKESNND